MYRNYIQRYLPLFLCVDTNHQNNKIALEQYEHYLLEMHQTLHCILTVEELYLWTRDVRTHGHLVYILTIA